MKLQSILLGFIFILSLTCIVQGEPVQIQEDFSADPRWDGWQNRVVGINNPMIEQDFGWSPTAHASETPGEIGGVMYQSSTPAHYGLPFGKPLSFKDAFSASGKIAIMPGSNYGPAYVGFFNSQRQGWRPWNSLAIRINPTGGHVRFYIDYKNGLSNSGGLDTDLAVLPDGGIHTWEIDYDPTARIDMTWPDPHMPDYLTTDYTPVATILERAKEFNPDLTHEELHKMLNQGRDQGIVGHWLRKGIDTYWRRQRPEDYKGEIKLQIDDQSYKTFLIPGMQDSETVIDRFGIFNFQVYHGRLEFYVGDLTVNGHKLDLTQDPRWEGQGNRVTFVEPDFHEKMDFGYSQTNWAGEGIGEIGGRFWSTEIHDPMHGYYADDIGRLTMDDPLFMSGTLYFRDAGPDARIFIGWFNAEEKKDPLSENGEEEGHPLNQSMGMSLLDSSDISHWFDAICAPTFELASHFEGPIIAPLRKRQHFSFKYDPDANNGIGSIVFDLDGVENTLNLKLEQRKAGATFDRFGIMNARRGGKHIDIYFDDLNYTTGRSKSDEPVRYKQDIVTYPYPPGGRRM